MPHYANTLTELFQHIDTQTVVLTPNQRLVRYLHANWARLQQNKGLQSWPSLNCFSRHAWFAHYWQQIQLRSLHPQSHYCLLNTQQENRIWQKIVANDSAGWELLNLQQIQNLAKEAWLTLRQWEIPLAHLDNELEETRQLIRWIEAYNDECEKNYFIDFTGIEQVIQQCIAESKIKAPESLILFGFDTQYPLFTNIINSLKQRQCNVNVYTGNENTYSENTDVQKYEAKNFEDEIKCAARWAAHLTEEDQSISVGIVIPELTSQQFKVERIFSQVFNPQYYLPDYPRHAPAFNISAAQPLVNTPPVAAALNALNLNRHELGIETLREILLSVFVGQFSDLHIRADLFNEIQASHANVKQKQLFSILKQAAGNNPRLAEFSQSIETFFTLCRANSKSKLRAFEWVSIFEQQLNALMWPGTRTLDSLEYQQISKWQDVLTAFVSLDTLQEPLSLSDALAELANAANQPFHAQTQHSPVQVLGLLEASGMTFDYLWVAQMDEQRWPPTTRPNPLIPLKMQVDKQMPRANASAELALAENLSHKLASSAQQTIFSFSRQGNNEELKASPLIQNYPPVENLPQSQIFSESTQIHDVQLEQLTEAQILPQKDEDTGRGGTGLIKDYAACPFRAFARYRLYARNEDKYESGIGARERGNLIHQVLDNIWHNLASQQALLQLNEEQIASLVDRCIASAWRSVFNQTETGHKLKELEITRTRQLILAWLDIEKKRSAFTVLERERSHKVSIDNLEIKLRYDRIDKLDNDQLLVIDYKTGTSRIADWAGERPNEPQVPVYAIAQKGKVAGAAFGIVNARQLGFEGISQEEGVAPGLTIPANLKRVALADNWQSILENWEDTLKNLANRWLSGEVNVDPKTPQTCRYCDLHSLCRIGSALDNDEEAAGDETF